MELLLNMLRSLTPVNAGVMDSVAAGLAMGADHLDPYFIVLGLVARIAYIK